MGGLFSYNFRFRSIFLKLLLRLGLAAFTLALGARSTRAAVGSIAPEEIAISAGRDHTCWLKAAFGCDRDFISATFPIPDAVVDLTISKAVTPDVAAPGQPIAYTLAFSNTGGDIAAGVVITDILPSELTGVSYQASAGRAITDTGHILSYVWQVQNLAPGEGGVITVTGIISPSLIHTAAFTNTATLSSMAADTDPANNVSSAKVMVGYPLADTPWPRFRRDMAQTGRSPYVGPSYPIVKWSFTTGNYVTASPAIGKDGTIYFGSVDQWLYAVNPDGSLKWKYDSYGVIFSAPAVTADGTVYFGSSYRLYALNPGGSLKWFFITNSLIFSAPAIGADGIIYFVNYDNLYALNPDGTLRWAFPGVGSSASPAIGSDGTIYIGSDKLYAIRSDGSLKWAYTPGGNVDVSSPAIGDDGTVYVGSEDQNLYAIDPNGNLKWISPIGKNIFLSSPAVGLDGTIYIGAYEDYPYAYFYALNPDGSLKWSSSLGEGIPSSPVIDGDGMVYISPTNGLYAFYPDGRQKWAIFAGGSAYASSPAIGADHTIYAGGGDNKLYAIREATTDLQIMKSVTPDVAAPGQPITYTLALSNTGGDLAAGVVITDLLPSELTGVSYQASPGLAITDTRHTPSYVWQVQNLAPGEGGVITITGIISPSLIHTAAFTNTATVSSMAADTDPADNVSSAKVMVGYPLADTPWPRFRRDMAQTGRSPYVGPSQPMVKWSFTSRDYVTTSPAIGMDGSIYFGSVDGRLYTANPDGSLKWFYPANYPLFSSPAIATDGTIYFGSTNGYLIALNSNGTLKWFFVSSTAIFSAPAIGVDGVIYFVNYENLYALNPDGTQRWIFPGISSAASPAIGPDGTIYIGSDKLYAIHPDGSLKWAYTPGGNVDVSSPAIGTDGTIYVGSRDQSLYAIDTYGNLIWTYPTGGDFHYSSAAIGPDGTLYITARVTII